MALTITSRGTGTHNTTATTLVPNGRSATLAVGSMGVLAISLDNAGSQGSTLCAPASWTDAKGNVWTNRINALYDNGAAKAGIEMVYYTAPITTALLTTDAGTITWAGGVSPTAKAWTWYEVIPSGANTVAYETGGNIAGATAANAQVTTSTIRVGDGVIAGYFSENTAAVTGDSDSTNGTWTAQQTATVGTTTSGVRIATQQKVQTTADSTQSYDVTVSSQDRIAGYIVLHEVVNTTVTPGVLALTTSAFAPTVTASDNKTATPGVLALTTATFAPTVTATQNVTVTPGAAALTATGLAPVVTASNHQTVTPGTIALTTATFAPTVTASDNKTATPDIASLTTTGYAPTVAVSDNQTVTPGVASLSLATFAPTVSTTANVAVTPDTAALVTSTFAPTVSTTANQTATPDTLALLMTAFAPTISISDHQLVTPDIAAMSITGYAPVVTVAGSSITVTPGPLHLTLTGYAPTVTGDEPQQQTAPGGRRLVRVSPRPIGGAIPDDEELAQLIAALLD